MAYTVNDQDTEDELTVVESLDGNEIRTIEDAVRNQTYTFALTDAQFAALANGQHTMQVKVTDTPRQQCHTDDHFHPQRHRH